MNPETVEPGRVSHLSSFLSLLFVSSTLNSFHQPSSSPPPSNTTPESTQQRSVSVTSMPLPGHSQINSISEPRVSYSCPNSLNTNPEISHLVAEEKRDDELLPETTSARRQCLLRVVTDSSIPSYPLTSSSAIYSREEGTASSFSSKDSFPESEMTHKPQPEAETTSRRGSNNKYLHVMEIMDEQDLGKHFLGLAIPTGVGLVVSASTVVRTTEIHIVVIVLSFAIAFICNGLFLRKTYRKGSTFILMSGAALMLLSFYSLVSCYLPPYLKWIPAVSWLASLSPFVMYGWASLRRDDKIQVDLEKGELIVGKIDMQSHISN